MGTSTALVLVSHDGAAWLPTVIDTIKQQTVSIDATIAVDTGSKDASVELLGEAFDEVLTESSCTSFPQAIDAALARTDAEWIWILHDDSAPAPTALAELMRAANDFPEVDIFGPKIREWPSLRRLLEVGVTITGTGRRHTGLERGETDQGQHDQTRTVLAVNTAGMLIRRTVLVELGGFDPNLPIFGNDVDLGWRAANAGHATMVVPEAVIFHAEAASRGIRRTPMTGRHTHFAERRAALYTLVVNAPGWTLPWQLVRLGFGTLLRMLGFFVVRSPGEALDELAAVVNVYTSPKELIAARRRRNNSGNARTLLAPWWVPYRTGMDFVSEVADALSSQAADVAERRRAAAAAADPASFAAQAEAQRRAALDDEDAMLSDSAWFTRLNPVMVLLGLVVVIGVVAARDGFGTITAPGLSPAPSSSPGWLHLHFSSWNPIGEGSTVPAGAYVVLLGLMALPIGAQGVVTAIMVGSFPAALWGAWRLLRVLGRLASPRGAPRWLMLCGAVTWALTPVVTGAWGEGRIGVVVSSAVLPWLLHASLGFAEPEPDRRWRAGWRAGLLLAVACAFTPLLWWIAVAVFLVAGAMAAALMPGVGRDRSVWGPVVAALATPTVLLSPWWLPTLIQTGGRGLLLDAGRVPGAISVFAPWWFTVPIVLLALAALAPRSTRIPVVACWMVVTVSAVVTLVFSWIPVSVRGGVAPAGIGVGVLVAHGALLVACLFGAQGALAGRKPRRWRLAVVSASLVAAVAPVVGMSSWLVGSNDLADATDSVVPAYMSQQAQSERADGILIITGSVEEGLTYSVRRGDGTTLGEDEIQALDPIDPEFEGVLADVVTDPTTAVMDQLRQYGVRYIVMPTPADPKVAEVIDAGGGVRRTSAADRSTPAWQLVQDATLEPSGRNWLRTVLLAVQMLGAVAVLVLCLPTVRTGRRRSGSQR